MGQQLKLPGGELQVLAVLGGGAPPRWISSRPKRRVSSAAGGSGGGVMAARRMLAFTRAMSSRMEKGLVM